MLRGLSCKQARRTEKLCWKAVQLTELKMDVSGDSGLLLQMVRAFKTLHTPR